MSERIAVCSSLPEYRVASAELPRRTRLQDHADGAIVAIAGNADWPEAVENARRAGARAVIVAGPEWVDPQRLAGINETFPVVLDRSLLRADLASDATPDVTPVAVVAEALAGGDNPVQALLDAVGWMRVLVGSAVVVEAAHPDSAGLLAMFLAPDSGCTLSLTASIVPGGSAVRALALGPTRTEVVVDPLAGIARVASTDERGERTRPRLFETRARLSLRRALAVLEGGDAASDVADFSHDAEAVARAVPLWLV